MYQRKRNSQTLFTFITAVSISPLVIFATCAPCLWTALYSRGFLLSPVKFLIDIEFLELIILPLEATKRQTGRSQPSKECSHNM
jgi:hypothetical protein